MFVTEKVFIHALNKLWHVKVDHCVPTYLCYAGVSRRQAFSTVVLIRLI